jgi:hypothetical protein
LGYSHQFQNAEIVAVSRFAPAVEADIAHFPQPAGAAPPDLNDHNLVTELFS